MGPHYGLTSSDVLDTAQGVLLNEAAGLLLSGTKRLFEVVKAKSLEHRATAMLGRTHGIWAERTTFGLKLADVGLRAGPGSWTTDPGLARLQRLAKSVAWWGLMPEHPSRLEPYVCEHLGLSIEPASSTPTAPGTPNSCRPWR